MSAKRVSTLNELLELIEANDDEIAAASAYEIQIVPAENENNLTDEDSGDEHDIQIENLPTILLNGEATLRTLDCNDDLSDDEDNIPLSQIIKRKRSDLAWNREKCDLEQGYALGNSSDQCIKENMSPLDAFNCFVDDSLVNLILKYSNMYAAKRNLQGNITASEIKCVIGILLLSGYNTMSRRRMYWEIARDSHSNLIANAMTRNRFEFILSNFHVSDNDNLPEGDKFGKVRELIESLKVNFLKYAPESLEHSVDEQMVPYYGKHRCKQYIHGKPIRYGFKFWVGATSTGYIVWFEPYQGAGTFVDNKYKDMGLGASVVLTYTDALISNKMTNVNLYFDNLFTSLPLLLELRNRHFSGTGTIRENRLKNCPLPSKKEMKKLSRGSYDYRKLKDTDILVCSWNDNNIVSIASNKHSVEPTKTVNRWCSKQKKRVNITQPNIIYNYNKYMGGVDRADQNISLYRISIRGKKWYFPIIAHAFDLAEHNAWQLYRSKGGELDHLSFRRRIAVQLITTYGNPVKNMGKSSAFSKEIRFDRTDHLMDEIPRLPSGKVKQLTCRQCHRKTSTKCVKCDVPLHVAKCNLKYHTDKD